MRNFELSFWYFHSTINQKCGHHKSIQCAPKTDVKVTCLASGKSKVDLFKQHPKLTAACDLLYYDQHGVVAHLPCSHGIS